MKILMDVRKAREMCQDRGNLESGDRNVGSKNCCVLQCHDYTHLVHKTIELTSRR